MTDIVNNLLEKYNYVVHDLADARTKDLLFISCPIPVILIVVLYLKFCTHYGPEFMKKRKPYELKYPIMLYNIFQIFFSLFVAFEGLHYFTKDYNFFCDPVVYTTEDPRLLRTARGCWYFFFGKITELLDTIFFVLRKKTNQVSRLHLFHHTVLLLSAWMFTKYFPGGPVVVLGVVNSFIHVLMYGYYFLAGLGPVFQKYLWWKKYITLIQMIQFVFLIVHNLVGLFSNCNYPKWVHSLIIANTAYVLYMFCQFYYRTYIDVKPKKVKEDEDATSTRQLIDLRKNN